MLIVEGCDGAGKSTLVRKLKQRYGFNEGERGTTDRKLLYTVTRGDTYNALGYAARGHQPVRIWDRLFYSELVYADIVGRPVEFSPVEQAYIRRMLDALRCPIIVCLPDYPTVEHNAGATAQMDGVNENLVRIYNRYVELIAGVFPKHALVYDYEMDNTYAEPRGQASDRGPYSFTFVNTAWIYADIDAYLDERRERTWTWTGTH